MLKYDSKPIQMLSRIVDLIVLNLLTILCSIPLITVGAARSALLNCLREMCLDRDTHLIAMYWKRFRQEWKNSTVLWLVYLLAAAWMILDIYLSMILNLGTFGFLT